MDEDAVLTKKIKSAVTDSDGDIRFEPDTKPGVSNLLTIFSLTTGQTIAEAEKHFAGSGYGDLKTQVAEAVVDTFRPIRERTEELLADSAELDRLLAEGATRAAETATATLDRVYDAVGFLRAQ